MKRLKITALLGILFIQTTILGCIIYLRYNCEASDIKTATIAYAPLKPDCIPPVKKIYQEPVEKTQAVDESVVEETPEVIETPVEVVKSPVDESEAEPIKVQGEEAKIESTAFSARIWTESDALMMAKVMYGEACGIRSMTEVACIGWTILNRVDAGWGSIAEVITAPYQFYYLAGAPTVSQTGIDLYALACDVLTRWEREHNGELYVGRVLPSDYMWYGGDGAHNHFRTAYSGGMIWDYSWGTVYPS